MGEVGEMGATGAQGPAGDPGPPGPTGITEIVAYGGLVQNVAFSPGSFVAVGSGGQLTISRPGQTVFGSVESTVQFDPGQVGPFRNAVICYVPSSQGPLDQVAAAAGAGGPQPTNVGGFAYQALVSSPASVTVPFEAADIPMGTYNFGLCEESGLSGSYTLVITQGWFAVGD
jgi:hypothetical protein